MRAAEGVGPYESGEQHNRGIVLDAESGRSPSSPSSVRTGGSFPRWGKHRHAGTHLALPARERGESWRDSA